MASTCEESPMGQTSPIEEPPVEQALETNFPRWPDGLDIAEGVKAGVPNPRRVEEIEGMYKDKGQLSVGVFLYALEMCKLLKPPKELLVNLGPIEEWADIQPVESGVLNLPDKLSTKFKDIKSEARKRRLITNYAVVAGDLCAEYSYIQLQGELKALTPKYTSPTYGYVDDKKEPRTAEKVKKELSTTPPVIKALNSLERSNLISTGTRRKAEGIFRVLVLIQRGREDEIPLPGIEPDPRHQFSPEELQRMQEDGLRGL